MPNNKRSINSPAVQALKKRETRAAETDGQREARLRTNRERQSRARSSETDEHRDARLGTMRVMGARSRRTTELNLCALHYDADINYSTHSSVAIGIMDVLCIYCRAFKFKNEAPGMCCARGKVNLPALHAPPEPLSTLVAGDTSISKHFLTNIRRYNSCFQMCVA